MKWQLRCVTMASVLALAACGGSEPRGYLSAAPRPELTEPPGDMSARLLIIVSQLPGLAAADSTVADGAKSRGAKWGTIGLSEAGVGLSMSADFRNALPGSYRLKLLDDESCSALVSASGDEKPAFVETIDETPVRLPQITVDEQGDVRQDFNASGVVVRDFKDRAVVLFSGDRPVACGNAVAAPNLPVRMPPTAKPPAGASPSGGR